MGLHFVWRCLSGCGTKLNHYRHAGGTGGDGRLPEFTHSSMASPANHTAHRHYACLLRDYILWRRKDGCFAGPQSGDLKSSVGICRYPAHSLYQRQRKDGCVCDQELDEDLRVGGCCHHYFPECEISFSGNNAVA